jgi:hypothetical protein
MAGVRLLAQAFRAVDADVFGHGTILPMLGRWFGFLRMTYAEMVLPLGVALLSAVALAVLLIVYVRAEWALLAPVITFIAASFWGWTAAFRRLRALEDLPTSHIGTCPQGYSRLEGRAQVFPGKPLFAPVSKRSCCWYRYTVVTMNDEGQAQSRETEETDWSFAMKDATGECVVDPAGAQIIPIHSTRYRDKRQQWHEEAIFPGDELCVVGHFTTAQSGISEAEVQFRVGELLAEWKRDMKSLLARFPPGHSTTYSEREWDAVRTAARREVESTLLHEPPQNRIEKPADGRPYIISTESPDGLERDLLIWAWIHALFFVAGVAALAWIYFRYL